LEKRPSIKYRQGSLYLAAALAAGIAGATVAGISPWPALAIMTTCLAAALTLVLLGRRRAAVVAALAAVVALGAYRAALGAAEPANSIARVIAANPDGQPVYRFRGIILERQLDGRFRLGGLSRYRVEARAVRTPAGDVPVSGFVLLDAARRDLPYGHFVQGTALFRMPPPPATPGQFDYAAYMRHNSISCLARAPQDGLIHVQGAAPRHAAGRVFDSIRSSLIDRMERLHLTESGVVPAIVIGETSALTQETRDAFIRSGTMHLLSISGLHVAIVAGLFLAFLRLIGVGMRPASYAAIAIAGAYTVLVGAGPPVVRSALMFGLFCLGMIVDRKTYALSIVSTTVFVMLLVTPLDIYDIGFQLSLVGVLGIIYLGSPLGVAWATWARGLKVPFRNALAKLSELTGYSIGAGIAVAPLTLYHFKIVSFISPLSNLVHIPITWAMLVSGMLAAGTSYVCGPVAHVFALSASGTDFALVETAKLFARIPAAYMYLPSPPVWLICVAYGLIALGALRAAARGRTAPIVITGLVASNLLIAPLLLPHREKQPEVVSLTDGRGVAVAVFDGRGHTALFSSGRGDSTFATRTICPYFLERGVTRIDALVETASADVRMRDALAERLRIGRIIRQRRWRAAPDSEPDSVAYGVTEVGPGDTIEGPGDVRIAIHCGEPQDYLDPSQPYFKGMIADVAIRGRRAVLLLDTTDGCLSVVGRKVAPRPNVLIVGSRRTDAGLQEQWISALSPTEVVESLGEKGEVPTSISAVLGAVPVIHPYVSEEH
jgi:competence protein ComEC